MPGIHWAAPVSGDFATAGNWSGGKAPGSNDLAALDAPGSAYTVQSHADETVDEVTLAANATLSITGGKFTVLAGTGYEGIAGRIQIGAGAALQLAGGVNNTGSLVVDGQGGDATLLLVANTILNGGGRLVLNNSLHDVVGGLGPNTSLTNNANTIQGGGRLGAGHMRLSNAREGIIEGDSATALFVDTGANPIINAGLVEAVGVGRVILVGAVQNTGTLEAAGGQLLCKGAVSGDGTVVIGGGTAGFGSSFSQEVDFTGATGALILRQSQAYGATIHGFSKTGRTMIDLRDIGFVSAGEVSFSGNATGGVLSVTDGVHIAHIHLAGDYTGSRFLARSDGHGGTMVTDPPMHAATHKNAAPFASAMAAFGSQPVVATRLPPPALHSVAPLLASPGFNAA